MTSEPLKEYEKGGENSGIGSRSIEKNIRKLKEAGLLIRHGSPKSGYWKLSKRKIPKITFHEERKL